MVERVSLVVDIISSISRYKCQELFRVGKSGWTSDNTTNTEIEMHQEKRWAGERKSNYRIIIIQCFPCHLGFPSQLMHSPVGRSFCLILNPSTSHGAYLMHLLLGWHLQKIWVNSPPPTWEVLSSFFSSSFSTSFSLSLTLTFFKMYDLLHFDAS